MMALSSRSTVASVRVAARQGLSRQQRCLVVPRYSTGHFTSEYTLSTEDRLEIIDLCHKFDHILNQGSQDMLGELFAPDAQVITPKGTVKGVGPILEYFHSCKPLAAGNRHLTCDILVEADGVRSAKATAYRLLHKCCSPPVLLASGTIEDKLTSINGEWRFSQRVFNMDPPASQPQQQQPAANSNGKSSQ